MRIIKVVTILVFLFLDTNYCFAQKKSNELEITPYFRWDSYPRFNYSINPTSSYDVKLIGTSFGLEFAYKYAVAKSWYIKAGVGYYRYSFTNIKQVNTIFGESKSRIIEGYVPSGPIVPSLIYSTNRYWYNSIMLNIGINKKIELNKNSNFILGAQISNYFSYSQLFHITSGENGIDYRTNDSRYFGSSVFLTGSFLRKVGSFRLGPNFLVPAYDVWKMDKNFPEEDNNSYRRKTLNGFGFGFSCVYPLN